MRLLLAPMEGVVDWIMRDTLTSIGGIDQCVTEFLRVTTYLHSDSIFLKNCPELLTNSKTRAGVPVFVQLLGGHPEPLAMNAARAAELGACGIDLNFGCPAKTVNRHDGGASLLRTPERIFKIVEAVRKAVPQKTPVTAKIRLGFDDPNSSLENARAVQEAGATWLTVHCRTKTDGYRPPAHWEWMPKIKEAVQIPLIANGEIWSLEDFERCRSVTDCDQFMIGRGALADPYIFQRLKGAQPATSEWVQTATLLPTFFRACEVHGGGIFATTRVKQWIKALALRRPEGKKIFETIKTVHDSTRFLQVLEAEVAAISCNPSPVG